MMSVRNGIRIIGILAVLWLGPAPDTQAETFTCWNNGGCQYWASCNGDYATGFCSIQCYQWSVCFDEYQQPYDCLIEGGAAGCGNPV